MKLEFFGHNLHANDKKYFIRNITLRWLYIFSTGPTICGSYARKSCCIFEVSKW